MRRATVFPIPVARDESAVDVPASLPRKPRGLVSAVPTFLVSRGLAVFFSNFHTFVVF